MPGSGLKVCVGGGDGGCVRQIQCPAQAQDEQYFNTLYNKNKICAQLRKLKKVKQIQTKFKKVKQSL